MTNKSNKKSFLITGIRGQDGQIATELLNDEGYLVHGITHEKNIPNINVEGCSSIWSWDWKSETILEEIILESKPDYLLNLAAFHHSSSRNANNLDVHLAMINVNLVGLELMIKKLLELSRDTKMVYASSSQIFSTNFDGETRVNEETLHNPSTFYGYTKSSAMKMIDFYRKSHALKASSAILFNHESKFRSNEFVTKKIVEEVVNIKNGISDNLHLRNVGAVADFSSAYDVVRAMISMCISESNDDYIVSSGKGSSILELVKSAFNEVGLEWSAYTTFDKNLVENYVIGDNTKIKSELKWKPEHDIESVIASMVKHEMLNGN